MKEQRSIVKNLLLLQLLIACFMGLVFVSGCAVMDDGEQVELIPRKVLFGNPVKASPQLSPDGSMMAYLAELDGVLNVWVRTIGQDDDRVVTDEKKRDIRRYFWSEDGEQIMTLQDADGDENWHLYATEIATGERKDLTPFEGSQVRIIATDKNYPNQVLVSLNKRDPALHDAYRLTLSTGEMELLAENPGTILGWMSDAQMKLRGAIDQREDGGKDLLIRDDEKSDWRVLLTWVYEDATNSHPVSFTKDGKGMYLVDSSASNTSQLLKLDIATGERETIIIDKQVDVGGIMMHPDDYTVQAVSFRKARKDYVVFDESIKKDFKIVSKLDDGDWGLISRDNADRNWLIGFTKDDGPVTYWAYDRDAKKGEFLFSNKPDLEKYTLADMEPFSFTSRDGLTIHGYLTFPPDKNRENLPMVLYVHGGPWHRDTWGYNPSAQWFANRGYLCMQVNFRGSTGYGKDFVNAADREWGGKMHDDLIDGVNWAVEKGYADSDRVAIFGGSYGGYAALVGVTFTPDVFACAVDVVGPSSIITLIESIPPYWKPYLQTFYRRVGHPEKDKEFLESRSPLFKVDQIEVPVLVAHGANDPRVKLAEAEQIVDALKRKGLDYEFLVFDDEGHGFVRPKNRMKFYAVAEKFLAKHLGGRYEEEEAGND